MKCLKHEAQVLIPVPDGHTKNISMLVILLPLEMCKKLEDAANSNIINLCW